jgi:two-component system, cell cycle sensor histidine kinase and response regulator CckA
LSEANQADVVRVLVVDDQFVVRDFVSRVLGQAGYLTATASDAGVAVKVAETFQPLHLLLTDLRMPGKSGIELARAMRARDPRLKVLYLTAFADSTFKEDVKLGKSEAFLDKPCTVQALLDAVSLVLFGHVRGC